MSRTPFIRARSPRVVGACLATLALTLAAWHPESEPTRTWLTLVACSMTWIVCGWLAATGEAVGPAGGLAVGLAVGCLGSG